MRRLLENAVLLVAVLVFLAVVRKGWEHRSGVSAWLGGSERPVVDAIVGWAAIGGLLVVVGLIPLRPGGRPSTATKALLAVPLVPWAAVAATYLWTPLAGDREGWLQDVDAGGDAFRIGVVAGHWGLAVSVVLCFVLGVAQIVSPRWQPGNPENERRSSRASVAALTCPSLLALVLAWVV